MNEKFDICIIGAGVIGLAIAERLSLTYNNILLVDINPKEILSILETTKYFKNKMLPPFNHNGES